MEIISLLIFIAIATLQIILLIKIWKMTDNVYSIKNKIESKTEENELYFKAKTAYVLGDLVKCQALLDEMFASEIVHIRNNSFFNKEYNDEFNSLTVKYTQIYEKMGVNMPDFSIYKEMVSVPQ